MKEIKRDGLAKGTTYIIISKIIFVLGGYGVNIISARMLGPESYGIIGIIISLLTVFTLFTVSGFSKATAKFISENRPWEKSLIKNSKIMLIIFVIIVFFILLLLSPAIAYFLGDISLVNYIVLTVMVVPIYAMFSLYSDGFLNGYRLFKKQAITYIVFSVSYFLVVVLLLLKGFNIESVIFGYLSATFCSFFITYYYFKKCVVIKGDDFFPSELLIKFAVPTILFQVSVLLIFNVDILIVKAILQDNIDTGYYTSASIIARAPYFTFNGLALTILPSISNSISQNKINKAKNQISKSIRYMLIVALPIIFLISATAKPLLNLIFTETYVSAADPLKILIFGICFLSFFNILAHIAMGSAKPKIALFTGVFTMIIAVVLNLFLVPLYDIIGAAIATTIASAMGLIIISLYIYQTYNVLIKILSFFKIVISSLIIFLIAYYINLFGVFLVLEYVVLILLYIALLWLFKEVDKKDINMMFHIIPFNYFKVKK